MGQGDEKLAAILRKGGSIVMHRNDVERLREARTSGQEPDAFKGVKIYTDRLGVVEEGRPIAYLRDNDRHSFDFGYTFK